MSEQYRVTRDGNRYEGGPDPYFKRGDVVVITGRSTFDNPDADGEIFANLVSGEGAESGYVRTDALVLVREIDPASVVTTPLESALRVLGLTKDSRLTYAQHEAVAYLAQKIKETREALNG